MDDEPTIKMPPLTKSLPPNDPDDELTIRLPRPVKGIPPRTPVGGMLPPWTGPMPPMAKDAVMPPLTSLPRPATVHLTSTPATATPSPLASPTRSPRKRDKRRTRIGVTLIICSQLLLLIGGILAYSYFDTNIQGPLGKIVHAVSRGADEPASNNNANTSSITGRSWNILLLGSDNDNKYPFPVLLTQVMMVVHVDTVNNSAYLVSIPRDSWVYVPGLGGMHKIDQAFEFAASQHNSFDDGIRGARLTVEKDYGITIDRYAWVGLSGFAKVVDTVGGIDIDVAHPVVDDAYPDDTGTTANDPYALERLYLAPGPQHLNGLQALEYVRSRHADLVGDIGRTQRQQQVLEALKKKLNVASVITHLPQLIADLNGQVYTDLSEQEIIAFGNYGRNLPSSAIHRLTLGPGSGDQHFGDYANVYDPVARANQDVIVPNCATIQPVMNSIFGLGDVQSCKVTG